MLRSMYSGISGMKANQTKLDVIGNNISNVNTTSFKSSRANFSDLLSQSSSKAQAASTTKGGRNAMQVGLGVQLASIDKIMTQGSMQSTNRALDVTIDGVGYFMVSTGPAIAGDGTLEVSHKAGTHSISNESLQNSGAQISYTRDGSFIRDNQGNLLTSSGYRVLGYSLTNDDNNMGATSISPTNVTVNDTLNFSFGPGSQLNGYKIQLGAIGAGTTTGATVDKNAKTITINGDFSEGTGLTPTAIESAIKSGLSQAGISQTIAVGGKVTPLEQANASKALEGGTDATAPESVTCAGFRFSFDKGEKLNNYSIKLGSVSADKTSAEVIGTTITISGDFVKGNVTAEDLERAINDAIKVKTDQKVKVSGGGASSLTQLSATAGEAKLPKEPTLSVTNVAGFTVNVDSTLKSSQLNGYTLKFTNTTGAPTVKVDKAMASIIISGDLSKIKDDLDKFNNDISKELASKGISLAGFKIAGDYDSSIADTSASFSGGEDDTSAGEVIVGGFKISTPNADKLDKLSGTYSGVNSKLFDKMQFVIGDINQETPSVSAKYDKAKGVVTISGNFAKLNGVKNTDLSDEINNAIKDGLGIARTAPVEFISVDGSNKVYGAIKSDTITGGTILKNPGSVEALGIGFKPSAGGSALNGYKIQIGKVTEGTKLEASVNTTSKIITVNGDFTKDLYTADDICNAVNKAISNSALGSGVGFEPVDTAKKPTKVTSTESENIAGGTSVQSLAADGSVYFVDGNTQVKSYDTSLKTLKIPETVKVPGTDKELAVKDYSIGGNGVITATLEDGTITALGQIAMASFNNPEGLTSIGNNLYSQSVNSGTAVIKSGVETTGDDNSSGYGDNIQGYLEMSNVDLAEQFTDMIVTTKAFQGSSKMITTGDEILSEIINLKR